MNADAAPAVGHNEPPTDADAIADRLTEAHAKLLARTEDLITAFERAPTVVEDETQASKLADYVKQLQAGIKNGEAARVEAKEPYLDGGRRVDGFFKTKITTRLEDVKKRATALLTTYQRKKAEEERQRRLEEERIAREAAEKARREAEERAAALREEEELPAAIEAEETARRADADAERARRQSEANLAEVSRTRSEEGSVASLRTWWTFDGLDRNEIDLEKLREHLPLKGIEQAVRSYIEAGGRKLNGVRIFEDSETVVR